MVSFDMITFEIKPHSLVAGQMVEVHMDGKVVAAIYPMAKGIKVVSAHFAEGTRFDKEGAENSPHIPVFYAELEPRPYRLENE